MQKRFSSIGAAACSATIFGAASLAHAAAFTPGNLAVFVATASSTNTSGSIIELDASTPGQPLQSIPIDVSGSNTALRFSGSATNTGYLSHSADGSLLTFTGAHTTTAGTNVNQFGTRGVGTLDPEGNFSLATAYSASGGNQTSSATLLSQGGDPANDTWVVADQGGLYINGTRAPDSGSPRAVKPFGGTAYELQASSSFTVISSIDPATGTATELPGQDIDFTDTHAQDFYMVSSNGSTYDILYILDAYSATSGIISKYSLVGGEWMANGTATTSFGGFSIAAARDEDVEDLYVTSGTGASTNNNLYKLVDDAGYNQQISIDRTTTLLYSAKSGSILKGVDFVPAVPVAVPEPASVGILAVSGIGLLVRRRR